MRVGTRVRAVGLHTGSAGALGGEIAEVDPDEGTCLVRMFHPDGPRRATTYRLRIEGLTPVEPTIGWRTINRVRAEHEGEM